MEAVQESLLNERYEFWKEYLFKHYGFAGTDDEILDQVEAYWKAKRAKRKAAREKRIREQELGVDHCKRNRTDMGLSNEAIQDNMLPALHT